MQEFHDICRERGIRLTTPRKNIFHVLHQEERPLFLTEISALCGDIDRSSIYRTLQLFSRAGIINIIPTGFKKRYELSGPFRPHHHHFICEQCHKVFEIQSTTLERLITRIGEKHDLTITRHTFELYGLCHSCAQNQKNK